jgi:5-methylcytosine-specific restriction protein A
MKIQKKEKVFFWMETERDKKQKIGWTEISQLGWYNTSEWKSLRLIALSENPLCSLCLLENKLVASVEVNHIIPANEDKSKFFDLNNLQPLCSYHHRVITRRDNSKYGYKRGVEGEKIKNKFNDYE